MPDHGDRHLRETWRELTGMHLDEQGGKVLETALRKRLAISDDVLLTRLTEIRQQIVARELAALADELTVRETSFYRHPQQFQALTEHLRRSLPGLSTAAGPRPVRAWSAGCASGEEAYTLAAVLRDALPAAWPVSVIGTDISEQAIAEARAGVYAARAFRAAPGELVGRYFERCEGRLAATAELRRLVEFRWHNLMDPLQGEPAFDVVFCRNVLIYFDTGARDVCLYNLSRALRPDGIVFFGPADLLTGANGLQPTSIGGVLAFQVARRTTVCADPATAPAGQGPAPPRPAPCATLPACLPTPDVDALWQQADAALAAGSQLRAAGLLETIQAHDPAHLDSRLEQILILVDAGQVEHALELCDTLLATPDLVADAYATAGIVQAAAGDAGRAIELLERAVAMDPSFAEAYVLLATFNGLIGKPGDRIQALENAHRALQAEMRPDEARRLRRFAAGFSAASLRETIAQQLASPSLPVQVT